MSDYIYTTNWPLSLLWLISNYSHVLLLRDQLWKNPYPLCSISFSCFSSLRVSFMAHTEHSWHFRSPTMWRAFPGRSNSLSSLHCATIWAPYSTWFWRCLPGGTSDCSGWGFTPVRCPSHFGCQSQSLIPTCASDWLAIDLRFWPLPRVWLIC